jgi:hypothetical protein
MLTLNYRFMVTKYFGFFGVNYARETAKSVSLKIDPTKVSNLQWLFRKPSKLRNRSMSRWISECFPRDEEKVPAGMQFATVTAD